MKNLLLGFVALFYSLSVIAQPPQAFNYQGIARDASGSPLVNKEISLRTSILQGGVSGTQVYRETHIVQSNKLGIFTIEVGHGTSQIGFFDAINWGSGDHYIQVEMDPDGGTNYTMLGESQLLSVPYALYAGNGSGIDNTWKKNGSGIYYNEGNVGIGTTNPSEKLSIQGNDNTGDARKYLSLNNQSISNRSLAWMELTAGQPNSATSLQHLSETYDFDGDKYTDFGLLASSGRGLILRADDANGVIKFLAGGSIQSSPERMRINSLGNVGIGTQDPQSKLSIVGNDPIGDARNYLDISNQSLSTRSIAWLQLSAGQPNSFTSLQHCSETYDFDGDKYTDYGQLVSSGRGLIVRASGEDGIIKFLLGQNEINSSVERMRLTNDGNLGVGTEAPASRIHVSNGDVYIEDIDNGVIMTSPDGNCWRMTIQNDGSVKTTAIACPE